MNDPTIELAEPPIIVVGRGHSGTRAISHTLTASGVFMGAPLNVSGDLIPAEPLYDACRVFARHVRHLGGHRWSFDAALDAPIEAEFVELVSRYLSSVTARTAGPLGWKLPETTLIYPWIVRMFPDASYIHWVRDPYDGLLGRHLTDDLEMFGVDWHDGGVAGEDEVHDARVASWLYQRAIVAATPRPGRALDVRFEDFVLDQENTLAAVERFLGLPLERIEARTDSVGRWHDRELPSIFRLLEDERRILGYR